MQQVWTILELRQIASPKLNQCFNIGQTIIVPAAASLTSLIKTDSKDTTTTLACILRVKVPHAIHHVTYAQFNINPMYCACLDVGHFAVSSM